MKRGKHIEKVIRLIHETLKDVPGTKIYSNYKIKNKSGRDREIDVLIESVIQNLEIRIAIECKDYKIPVPVEKIEAFNSKCSRIKGISKKIFVSTNGYQADSIEAAHDFEIELYNISEISISKITSWFSIVRLEKVIKIQLPLSIGLNCDLNDIEEEKSNEDLNVYYYENDDSLPMVGFIWNNFVVKKSDEIRAFLILSLLRKKQDEPVNKHYTLPFEINLTGVYILGKNNKKLPVSKVESALEVWFEETPANIIDARAFSKKGDKVQANTLTVELSKNQTADLVFGQNKISIFHTDSNGTIFPMETIAKYDSKSDKLEFLK